MTHIPGSYIRDRYKKDAYLNGQVIFEGKKGRIEGFDGVWLLVRFDDSNPEDRPARIHPTEVDYLDADGRHVLHRGEAR